MIEKCQNCNEVIGNFEPAFLHHGNVVCAKCNARLTAIPVPQMPAVPLPAVAQRANKPQSPVVRTLVLIFVGVASALVITLAYAIHLSSQSSHSSAGPSQKAFDSVTVGMDRDTVHSILGEPSGGGFGYSNTDTWQTSDGHTIEVHYDAGFDRTKWLAVDKAYR
jgi:hypothetical protein